MLGVVENMNVNQIRGRARVGHVRGGASRPKKSSLLGHAPADPRRHSPCPQQAERLGRGTDESTVD